MSDYLSDKIKIISFVSIIMVVILHSHMLAHSSGMSYEVQRFITGELVRVAVPVFFFISGYLFFHNFQSGIKTFYLSKLKSRVHTLLIPYLICSFIGVVVIYAIGKITGKTHDTFHITDTSSFIYTLLWNPIGSYQLWFIRDLFCLVVLSPLMYYILTKRILSVVYLVAAVCYYFSGARCLIGGESVFYFSSGAYIALNMPHIMEYRMRSKKIMAVLFIVFVAFCFLSFFISRFPFHYISNIVGVALLFSIYDAFLYKYSVDIKSWSIVSLNFFIYLCHEPLLTIIKSVNVKIIGHGYPMAIYVITPVMTLLILWMAGRWLKMFVPNIYKIITGGR